MTRHFFKRAHDLDKPPKVRRPERPDHRGKIVQVEVGHGQYRLMSSREAALQMGRSKGGQTAHARGVAHRWTSEEATKAIKKAWATRWRMNDRIGARIGRPAKNRPPVSRKPLRVYYMKHPTQGVTYNSVCGWTVTDAIGTRTLSEAAALRRLGHLPRLSKPIPKRILKVVR